MARRACCNYRTTAKSVLAGMLRSAASLETGVAVETQTARAPDFRNLPFCQCAFHLALIWRGVDNLNMMASRLLLPALAVLLAATTSVESQVVNITQVQQGAAAQAQAAAQAAAQAQNNATNAFVQQAQSQAGARSRPFQLHGQL